MEHENQNFCKNKKKQVTILLYFAVSYIGTFI